MLSTHPNVEVDHSEKMHELPDEHLADVMPIAKQIALAQGVENYNILQVSLSGTIAVDIAKSNCVGHQNNGAIAHQV